LFQNDVYEENSNVSNAKLLSKIIIKELDEWWKKKIDSPDFESTSEYVFFIELQTKNLKENILIEKRINEILGKKGFILHEFNNREIIYKVTTRYDLEQLNLALETDNLRLEKSTKKENLFRACEFSSNGSILSCSKWFDDDLLQQGQNEGINQKNI